MRPKLAAVSTTAVSAAAPATPVQGDIDVSSKPPCEVAIDGTPTGRHTPLTGYKVEPGIHRVTLINDKLGISETVTVQVLSDKPARIVKDYMSKIDPNGTIDPFKHGSAAP